MLELANKCSTHSNLQPPERKLLIARRSSPGWILPGPGPFAEGEPHSDVAVARQHCCHNNSICDDGASALVKALKENSTLTYLGLAINSIGDDGASALVKALKENSTLTELHLANNSIGNAGKHKT